MTRPTREQILQATPGQQLDAWVAEHVLGWEPWGVNSDWDDSKYFQDEQGTVVGVSGDEDDLTLGDFNPSRDWNDAMRVRDKVMSELHLAVDFTCALEKCVAMSIEMCHPVRDVLLIKHLQPLSICQAALLAVCGGDDTNRKTP